MFPFFSDDTTNFLRKDYECLQTFLSMTISDEDIVHALNKSPSIQEISAIINGFRKGDKQGSQLSSMKKCNNIFLNKTTHMRFYDCVEIILENRTANEYPSDL